MLRNSCSCGLSAPSASVSRLDGRAVDARRLARVDRQLVLEVAQPERAVAEDQLQLPALEHVAVLIAEDRQQQLGVQLRLDRRPVDVEELRRRRARSVLEHVVPPRVGARADAHVVRARSRRRGGARGRATAATNASWAVGAAELGVDLVVVADVVAVRAARRRGEVRRGVDRADAEPCQIRHDVARRRSAETRREPAGDRC